MNTPGAHSRFDNDSANNRKIFHVNRPAIPKHAINNAANKIKNTKPSTTKKSTKSSHRLPQAMQKMITSSSRPAQPNLKQNPTLSNNEKTGCFS